MHGHARKALAEFGEHGRARIDERFRRQAERHLSRVLAAKLLRFLRGALAFAEDRRRALQHALSESGERDAAIGTREERRAEQRLEVLQLLRDAALRDAERARRGAD